MRQLLDRDVMNVMTEISVTKCLRKLQLRSHNADVATGGLKACNFIKKKL